MRVYSVETSGSAISSDYSIVYSILVLSKANQTNKRAIQLRFIQGRIRYCVQRKTGNERKIEQKFKYPSFQRGDVLKRKQQ